MKRKLFYPAAPIDGRCWNALTEHYLTAHEIKEAVYRAGYRPKSHTPCRNEVRTALARIHRTGAIKIGKNRAGKTAYKLTQPRYLERQKIVVITKNTV